MIRDALGSALLIVAAFVPGVAERGLEIGELHLRDSDPAGLALLLIQAFALTLRRREPAHQIAGYPPNVAGLALLVAFYSAGAHQERFRRAAGVTAAAAYAVLAVALHLRGSGERLIDFITFSAVLAGCWAAGTWVRGRQAQERHRRQESVNAAITAERARIARELHDVVTHHVTAMVVQSDTAGLLIGPQPERAGEAVAAVGRSGREALTELRVLLGVLEGGLDERAPTEGRLTDLVDRMRRAGQPVDFTEEGGPGPDGGLGLAVHRVVQEGLTNAVKHAPGRPTRVLVRHDGDGTAIEVVTAGSLRGEVRPGRGLTGLRERIKVFGGTFGADGGPEGDFTVRAWLPRSRAEAGAGASPSATVAGGAG
jgi:signal transduction histidine kinase